MDKYEMDAIKRNKEKKQKAEALAKELTSFFNNYDTDGCCKALSDALMNEHRTLQQSVGRFMMYQITVWAETNFYDGRNQATVRVCKDIVEKIGKENMYLPMI